MVSIGSAAIEGAAKLTEIKGAPAAPSPRLINAAHEFEAQMMKELLKPLTDSDGLTGEDGDAGMGSAGALGEFASEALGRAISDQGGLGIASHIVQSLAHRSANRSDSPHPG